jgi:hypothetical protein
MRNDIDMLLSYDQLLVSRQKETAFPFFTEAKITFLPTYKFDIGSSYYDTRYLIFL